MYMTLNEEKKQLTSISPSLPIMTLNNDQKSFS